MRKGIALLLTTALVFGTTSCTKATSEPLFEQKHKSHSSSTKTYETEITETTLEPSETTFSTEVLGPADTISSSNQIKVLSAGSSLNSYIENYASKYYGYSLKNLSSDYVSSSYIDEFFIENPDIIICDDSIVSSLINSDFVYNLISYEELFGADNLQSYLEESQMPLFSTTLGTSTVNNKLMGLSSTDATNMFIYRKSIASKVFGTDNPDDIATIIGANSYNWDAFYNAAVTLSSSGYTIVSCPDELWSIAKGFAPFTWYDSNNHVVINSQAYDFVNVATTFYNMGAVGDVCRWSYNWFDSIGSDNNFGYIGPQWYLDYVVYSNASDLADDFAVCALPCNTSWGGNWILVNRYSDKLDVIKDILYYMLFDYSSNGMQYQLLSSQTDMPASIRVYFEDGYYCSSVGGQNLATVVYPQCMMPYNYDPTFVYDYDSTFVADVCEYYTSQEVDVATFVEQLQEEYTRLYG